MKLLKHNGNIALFGGSQFTIPDLSVIELEVGGASFLDNVNGSRRFGVYNREGGNEMYIDFNDGTGEHTYLPNSGVDFSFLSWSTASFYTYQDGYSGRRKIKIRFKDHKKVEGIVIRYQEFYGVFPKSLSVYNLNDLVIYGHHNASYSRFENFTLDFRASKIRKLDLRNISNNIVKDLPEWIVNSEIQELTLLNSFDLSDVSTNNISRLVNQPLLSTLTLANVQLNVNSLPSNLKDFPSLKTLNIQGSTTLTTLPSSLVGCTNIENLELGSGSSGFGFSHITSWGNGVSGMTSLKSFVCNNTTVANIPTTIITGLQDCVNLNFLDLVGGYRTEVRMTEFLNNFYDFTLNERNFSNFSLNIGWKVSTFKNIRPVGVYQQPADYIDNINFGTPTTPMEQIWVLVNVFGYTITITNTTDNGSEILTP